MKLNNISSVRVIKTLKCGLDVYLLIIGFTDGKSETTSHMSSNGAFSRLKRIAPHLDSKFFKVEGV